MEEAGTLFVSVEEKTCPMVEAEDAFDDKKKVSKKGPKKDKKKAKLKATKVEDDSGQQLLIAVVLTPPA